ncbi:class I SAM-dependent methyltransferase [Pelodictyon phaeoclathratiforme]|uniref:Methyltransferase type 11 n=1 Tax=Pelodictyon phaeoclathratiforme (strain DSM 5477 / BU-1) TaxID=324925 RepID=B4SD61_PELPB|nr:class I SAM-dependent methyltransferase [Pelodictyon phaeoclathratiforme]ACF44320.1 Methyltransferase type 11 [Pelodictyon phaeoclathratiforme BU-1]MBV5289468.1 class I SAM-dependent methyltransferase [Pelodictyon phaeoclathratiforme]
MSFYSEFAVWYEQLFPFREEVYLFLREHAAQPGSTVLDAGCGPGHYCSKFQQEGFLPTGIDLDPKMIATATATSPLVAFQCMDIADLASLKQSFRLIYSIGNVIAHLSPERFSAFLSQVYAALEPGGCWIFQTVNWDYLLTLSEYRFPVKTVGDGSVSFYRRYPNISPEEVIFEVELQADNHKIFSEQAILYPLTADSFRQRHEATGFTTEGIYAGFDKTPFSREHNSGLVMVFTKR